MKILVFSDAHGRSDAMCRAISVHSDASYLFFLGDGIGEAMRAAAAFPRLTPVFVRGNCDFSFAYGDVPTERTLDLGCVKVFMNHGHTTGVKHGLTGVITAAADVLADVCLFGHTHVPYLSYENDLPHPMYVMNPGSIGMPHDGIPTYGIIEARGGSLLLSHGRIAYE